MVLDPVRGLGLRLALWSARRPWLALATAAVLLATLAAGLPVLRIDASNEAMFGSRDQAQVEYTRFQREFGREDALIVAVSSPQLFSGEFMARLHALHRDLEQAVPWVDEVVSLANVAHVDKADGTLRSGPLRQRWPGAGPVAPALRDELLQDPLYRRTLLSPDGTMTLLVVRPRAFVTPAALQAARGAGARGDSLLARLGRAVHEWHDSLDARLGIPIAPAPAPGTGTAAAPPASTAGAERAFPFEDPLAATAAPAEPQVRLPGAEMRRLLDAARDVVRRHEAEGFSVQLSGGPVIDDAHETSIHRDAAVMTALALAVAIGALALQLRSLMAVSLAAGVIVLSLLATLGLMGWLDLPVTVVSQALPPILLTTAVLGLNHLLAHFLQSPEGDLEQAVRHMVEHCGVPVMYAVLTDALAFLGFTMARLQPIAQFGWMAAFGALAGLLFTFLLLPALLRLVPVRRGHRGRDRLFQALGRGATALGVPCGRRARWVLAITALLALAAVPGIARLKQAHDVLGWLEPGHPVRMDTLAIDARMQATMPLEIVLDTGREDGILEPGFIAGLRALQAQAQGLSGGALQVGGTTSMADSIARVHRVLTDGEHGALPTSAALLQQEWLLVEGGGARTLQRLADARRSKARVTIRLAWADAHAYAGLEDQLRAKAAQLFGPQVKVTVTGMAYLQALGALDVIDSMWSSYLVAAGLIACMLLLVLRDWRLSLASLLPNFLPVWLALGVMGALAWPVDMFVVLLGDVALAVSVDDTVHFMHTASRHRRQGLSAHQAVRRTLADVGAPLVMGTVVMASGLFVFVFSSMAPLSHLGGLLAATLLLALLLDLTVSPALVSVIGPRRTPAPRGRSLQELSP